MRRRTGISRPPEPAPNAASRCSRRPPARCRWPPARRRPARPRRSRPASQARSGELRRSVARQRGRAVAAASPAAVAAAALTAPRRPAPRRRRDARRRPRRPGPPCPARPTARCSRRTTCGTPTSPSSRSIRTARVAGQHGLRRAPTCTRTSARPGGYPYGIPFTVVTSAHQLVRIKFSYARRATAACTRSAQTRRSRAARTPAVTGTPSWSTRSTCTLYELWNARYSAAQPTRGLGRDLEADLQRAAPGRLDLG